MDLSQLRIVYVALNVEYELLTLSHVRNTSQSESTKRTKNCATLRVKDFRFKGNVYEYEGHRISRR
jgi:hypothetical protein